VAPPDCEPRSVSPEYGCWSDQGGGILGRGRADSAQTRSHSVFSSRVRSEIAQDWGSLAMCGGHCKSSTSLICFASLAILR